MIAPGATAWCRLDGDRWVACATTDDGAKGGHIVDVVERHATGFDPQTGEALYGVGAVRVLLFPEPPVRDRRKRVVVEPVVTGLVITDAATQTTDGIRGWDHDIERLAAWLGSSTRPYDTRRRDLAHLLHHLLHALSPIAGRAA